MKYILILLTTALFAQVPFIPIGMNIESISIDEKICWKASEIITVKDILEYAEECYNDSTEDYYHLTNAFPCVSYMTDYGSCYNAGHRDSIYFRHPTPTFPGFIEWFGKR